MLFNLDKQNKKDTEQMQVQKHQQEDNKTLKYSKAHSKEKGNEITEKTPLKNVLTIEELKQNDVELISNGAFSMHQLAMYLIKLIAPCNIYASTFATNEKIVAMLINARQKGLINTCKFLFDHKVMKYRPNAYYLFKENFGTAITAIHAKICIIESKEMTIKIIGSGNWTRNDKIEVYNISIDKKAGEFYKQFIENQINGAKER